MRPRPPTHHELRDSHAAFNYAHDVIRGSFPEGEPAIAKSAEWSTWYAVEVLHARFPAGERAIAGRIDLSRDYLEAFGILPRLDYTSKWTRVLQKWRQKVNPRL